MLYDRLCRFENLYNAYLKARKNKRYRQDVLEFSINLEDNLINIQRRLMNGTYKPGPYYSFYVNDPKRRLILALGFEDRVVQHALNNIIEPIFERSFIFDSYACRKGKGTHTGADRLTYFLRKAKRNWGKVYCFKGDIQQYFPSIDRGVLFGLISLKIKDVCLLKIIKTVIFDTPGIKGIPIGNLTSQLFANIYLSELDHFIKEKMRIKYYLRYMDDFVVLEQSKISLRSTWTQIEHYLIVNLRLNLNQKSSIFPIDQGVDFLGYRIWPTHRLLRKRSMKRMRRGLKHFQTQYSRREIDFDTINRSVSAWIGHAQHANTYNLRRKMFRNTTFMR